MPNSWNISGAMLSVSITGADVKRSRFERKGDSSLDSSTRPQIQIVAENDGAGCSGHVGGSILGAVVYYDDAIAFGTQSGHHRANGLSFVIGGNDHPQGVGIWRRYVLISFRHIRWQNETPRRAPVCPCYPRVMRRITGKTLQGKTGSRRLRKEAKAFYSTKTFYQSSGRMETRSARTVWPCLGGDSQKRSAFRSHKWI